MKEYAFGASGAHQAAVRADRAKPYHHESAFVRFRPYASSGSWDGRDPLGKWTGLPSPTPRTSVRRSAGAGTSSI